VEGSAATYSEQYHDTRRRLGAVVGTLDDARAHAHVAACPAWDVHDVIAHVSGVPEMLVDGRRPAGGSQALIEAAVTERRDVPIEEMLARWEACTDRVSDLVDRIPLFLVDLVCHEHDVRQALGSPGARSAPEVRTAVELFLTTRLAEHIEAAGLGALCVDVGDATWQSHDAPVACTIRADSWEVLRVLLSRRTADEVRALPTQGDVEPYIAVFADHSPLPTQSLHERE
jgi:uncharacterized protein (TIGR03083 family)